MPKFKVRYTGQDEEAEAAHRNRNRWIAEEIYEEDENG